MSWQSPWGTSAVRPFDPQGQGPGWSFLNGVVAGLFGPPPAPPPALSISVDAANPLILPALIVGGLIVLGLLGGRR